MSFGAWVRPLSSTLGTAAAAGAAQLGIAYGLAILVWTAEFTDAGEAAWTANLTWVCWLSATAVVLGAMAGARLTEAAGLRSSYLTRAAVVLSSAVGALVTVPLVALPARFAEVANDPAPVATTAQIAAIGVLLGAVVSVGVLLGRPLAWNVIATVGWLWLLALASVLTSLGTGGEPPVTRLGVWSVSDVPGWFVVMIPMLVAAIGLGTGIAWYAKQQGCNRVSVAVCGAPGPVLVAVAYLVAGPGSRPEASEQFLPYLAAPYTVLAGLLGSLLVAAIELPEQADDEPAADAAGRPAVGADRAASTRSEVVPWRSSPPHIDTSGAWETPADRTADWDDSGTDVPRNPSADGRDDAWDDDDAWDSSGRRRAESRWGSSAGLSYVPDGSVDQETGSPSSPLAGDAEPYRGGSHRSTPDEPRDNPPSPRPQPFPRRASRALSAAGERPDPGSGSGTSAGDTRAEGGVASGSDVTTASNSVPSPLESARYAATSLDVGRHQVSGHADPESDADSVPYADGSRYGDPGRHADTSFGGRGRLEEVDAVPGVARHADAYWTDRHPDPDTDDLTSTQTLPAIPAAEPTARAADPIAHAAEPTARAAADPIAHAAEPAAPAADPRVPTVPTSRPVVPTSRSPFPGFEPVASGSQATEPGPAGSGFEPVTPDSEPADPGPATPGLEPAVSGPESAAGGAERADASSVPDAATKGFRVRDRLFQPAALPPGRKGEADNDDADGARHEWDDDERWLERIKGDDSVRPRLADRPAQDRSDRSPRRWSLFSDDDFVLDEKRPTDSNG